MSPRLLEVDELNGTADTCPKCGSPIIWRESVWDRFDGKKRDPFLCCVKWPGCRWNSSKMRRGNYPHGEIR